MHQKTAIVIVNRTLAEKLRESGEALGRLTWLRGMLTIPGIALLVVVSRTLNVCAEVLLAYAAFLTLPRGLVGRQSARTALRYPQISRPGLRRR